MVRKCQNGQKAGWNTECGEADSKGDIHMHLGQPITALHEHKARETNRHQHWKTEHQPSCKLQHVKRWNTHAHTHTHTLDNVGSGRNEFKVCFCVVRSDLTAHKSRCSRFPTARSLYKAIRAAGGRLPPKTAQLCFAQISSSMAYCHGQGVAHLDLKPENMAISFAWCVSNHVCVTTVSAWLSVPRCC